MDEFGEQDEQRIQFFRHELLEWWRSEGRTFPWRNIQDPYSVLIAELMLRRTRADQVVPVYKEFLMRYPNIFSLAAAEPADVSRLLHPLGLAWRVAAFRDVATLIVREHSGTIPSNRDVLLALPGVGDYVADAIQAFAFNMPTAVVDTNTVRVIGRYQGFPIQGEARRRREAINQIRLLIEGESAKELNFAVIDLGALICRPTNPRCGVCPVQQRCQHALLREPIKTGHERALKQRSA